MKPQRTEDPQSQTAYASVQNWTRSRITKDIFADLQLIVLVQPCWLQLIYVLDTQLKMLLSDDMINEVHGFCERTSSRGV